MKRPRRYPKWWRVHNLVAHPLLILWPRLGVWLHDRTAPTNSDTQTGLTPPHARHTLAA